MTDLVEPMRRTWTREVASLAILCALGALLLVVTALALRIHAHHWNLFVLMLLLSGLIAVAATKVAGTAPTGLGLAVVLGFALIMRLLVLNDDPILSTDLYRYVWDGRVQAAGINPYQYVPADPALAGIRDSIVFPNINRADYATTIYPPVAQFFFFAVTRIGDSLTSMRLALIGCEVMTLIALIDLLRRFNKPVTLATAYAWHPLALWEIANNGHIDALMVALVMGGVWLLARNRRIAAGTMVALAALVKPYAIVALPACWRPWDSRLPLAVILIISACYLPYLGVGKGVIGFLANGYLYEEGFQGGNGFWLVHAFRSAFGDVPGLLPAYVTFATATLGFLALRAAFAADQAPQRTTRDVAMLLLAGLFFLSPNYPWYVLVVVPFIPIGGGAPAWVLSVGAILLYLLYPDYEARFLLWKGVLNVAFLITVAVTLIRRSPSAAPTQGLMQWMR